MIHNYTRLKGIAKLEMNTIVCLLIFFGMVFTKLNAQENEMNSTPYLETLAIADTLVVPDRFYLTIRFSEASTKGRISTEEVANKMKSKLKDLGLDLNEQLALTKVSSNHRRFFLRKNDVYKHNTYTILAYDITMANNIIVALEAIDIANISLTNVEFSKEKELRIRLKEKAIQLALEQAKAIVSPLNQKVSKVIGISDSTGAVDDAVSKMTAQQSQFGCRMYYVDRFNINLGLQMKKIRISNAVQVTFALD